MPDQPIHAAPLIARLAVDRRFQKQGLGGRLLIAALAGIVTCFDRIGGPVIAVQPADEKAVAFYKHYGFVEISGAKHMFLRVSTAKKAIMARS
jgi:GNAT superfamily N-acetyltransferase